MRTPARDLLARPETHVSPELAETYRRDGAWRKRTLGSYLTAAAAARPDTIAAVSYESATGTRTALTYAELRGLVQRLSSGLASLGVEQGDVVTVMLPNRHEFAALIHAIVERGGVYSGIPATYGRREAGFMLAWARSRVFVVPQAFRGTDHVAMARDLWQGQASRLEHVVVLGEAPGGQGWHTFDELAAADPRVPAPAVDPGSLVHIGFTSGTTAEPKGVMNTHQTLDAVLRRWLEHIGGGLLDERSVNLIASPVGHHTGFLWGVLMTAYLGGTAVFLDRWDAETAADVIEREGVTTMVAAPTFLQDLLEVAGTSRGRAALRSLRMIAIPGAPIPRPLVPRAREQLGCFVCPAWGMTEYGIGISGSPTLPRERVEATDGIPVAGCDVRVVDPGGEPVAPGEEGDLEIRGAGLFLGYYERPDATEEAIVDGWFRTGDRAAQDADGFVSLTGRTKDIVIRGGENVPVAAIESLLHEHPLVAEATVVGVPDERLGERACAVVALRAGGGLSLPEVAGFLLDRGLSKHFLPERLEVVASLPKTASGKVRKVELRTWLAQGAPGPGPAAEGQG
jgi:cyclohexanecarboxylate-CoA ligase